MNATRYSPGDVAAAVCQQYRLKPAELLGHNTARRYSWPRFVAYILARRHTNRSYPQLGLFFGARDHTTIMHGERRGVALAIASPEFAAALLAAEQKLIERLPPSVVVKNSIAEFGISFPGRRVMPWPPIEIPWREVDLFEAANA